MISNLEIVGYYCLFFAYVLYIINFKEINKEMARWWHKIIQEGREQYYLEKYPKGYFLSKPYKRNSFYYQTMFGQHYYRDMLYSRKIMKK